MFATTRAFGKHDFFFLKMCVFNLFHHKRQCPGYKISMPVLFFFFLEKDAPFLFLTPDCAVPGAWFTFFLSALKNGTAR